MSTQVRSWSIWCTRADVACVQPFVCPGSDCWPLLTQHAVPSVCRLNLLMAMGGKGQHMVCLMCGWSGVGWAEVLGWERAKEGLRGR
jgi:hypothetical protein